MIDIAAVQNRHNLAGREHDDVIDYCEREGVAFVPYYPLREEGGPGVASAAARLALTREPAALELALGDAVGIAR